MRRFRAPLRVSLRLLRLRRSGIGPVDCCGNRWTCFSYSSANCCSDFLAVVCALYEVISSQKHLVELFSSWRECASLSSFHFLHFVGNTASGFNLHEWSPLRVSLFLRPLQLCVPSVRWVGVGVGGQISLIHLPGCILPDFVI